MDRRAPSQEASTDRARSRSFVRLIALGVASVAAVIVAAALWVAFGSSDSDDDPPKAAIVDQLAFNIPNERFVGEATGLLERAGYEVHYYPSDQVDVDFYRDLPAKGYDFLLLRAHADRLEATADDGTKFDDVVLFTTEPYDESRYVSDQADNNLVIAKYTQDGDSYFGVAPQFFEAGRGDFGGATVVVMGCEGFLTERTAQAFVEDMGADAYISWNETVSASHTDQATEVLLRHLLVEKKAPTDAVALTMADVGPDPIFGSRLEAYPPG